MKFDPDVQLAIEAAYQAGWTEGIESLGPEQGARMSRLKRFAKWFLAALLILVASKTTADKHEQTEPIFQVPGFEGGGDGDEEIYRRYLRLVYPG